MRAISRFGGPALLAAVFLIAASASPALAQYFGQNKVQYRDFHFEVLHTQHFDIYFYRDERAAAEQAARMAERWYARLSRVFSHDLHGRQPLILYADQPDFQQTNAIEGMMGEGTGGVTEIIKRRIVLPMGASLAESNHVIGHELVHAFQFDMTTGPAGGGSAGAQIPSAERLPLWFIEGLAEYLSLGPVDPNTTMWVRDAVEQDHLPKISDLDKPEYFPYRWGQALWAYVGGRWGDQAVGQLLNAAAATARTDVAFSAVLGEDEKKLSADWQQALKSSFATVAHATQPTTNFGHAVIKTAGRTSLGGDLNVSPALSPDGTKLMFLSERGLFSVDLYMADAKTGKILRHVVKTAVNPHFSSLEFIYSAGAWAPDSRRFVFSAVSNGKPELVVLDTASGQDREVRFPTLGEIFNPTWSPDGRQIAFSATVGGFTDLFIYGLQNKQLHRVTNDAYADLQPAWSPDGRHIVFVTDRFSTGLPDLKIGQYELALLDPATGKIDELRAFPNAKNISPQWAADSGSVFFVSDQNGISNVYRVELAGGTISQVTNVMTGISGITAISPAISVAPRTRELAFGVYENGGYSIYTTAEPTVLAGTAPVPATTAAAVLPPVDRNANSQIAQLLENPTLGLTPPPTAKQVGPYKSHLSLDYVGQPYLAAGVDPYGTFAGGGVSFFWSDMLGNKSLATALQLNSGFGFGGFGGGLSDIWKNSGGLVAYQDLTHRWNWGVAVSQMPFLSGGFLQGVTNVNGSPALVQQNILLRQVERDASAVVAYPFNQAQRVEVSGGFTNISFDQQVETIVADPTSGNIISDQTQTTQLADSLNLGMASAALVYDTSVFGATSPILGQRYRLEVAPTIGSIRFNSFLADYRRYFMPAQLYTIAARVIHYGRYGTGSEDPRLFPLFLGYPNLVRGYDVTSFDATQCGNNINGTCPAFDQLLGSKMLIGNLEFRFPLLRPFGLRRSVYGPVPVEVAFFGDAGVAWNSGQKPSFFGGDRRPVSSAGVTFRVNAMGFAVLQFDAVRPFSRPGQGWMFEFSISPGW